MVTYCQTPDLLQCSASLLRETLIFSPKEALSPGHESLDSSRGAEEALFVLTGNLLVTSGL